MGVPDYPVKKTKGEEDCQLITIVWGMGETFSILHLSIASVSIETEIVKTESRLPKEMWKKKNSVPQKAKMNATKPSGTIEDTSTRQLANILTQNEPQVPLNLKECLIPKDNCVVWYLYQRNIQTYRSAKRGCPRHEASFRSWGRTAHVPSKRTRPRSPVTCTIELGWSNDGTLCPQWLALIVSWYSRPSD